MRNLGRKEAEMQYKEEIEKLKVDHKQVQESLKEQVELFLKECILNINSMNIG